MLKLIKRTLLIPLRLDDWK